MYTLGDSTIPSILQGTRCVGGDGTTRCGANNPTPSVPSAPVAIPLILQGGGTYNYPEIYGGSSSSYTPPGRARADLNKVLMVAAAAVGIGFLLPTGSKRRSLW